MPQRTRNPTIQPVPKTMSTLRHLTVSHHSPVCCAVTLGAALPSPNRREMVLVVTEEEEGPLRKDLRPRKLRALALLLLLLLLEASSSSNSWKGTYRERFKPCLNCLRLFNDLLTENSRDLNGGLADL